MRDHGEVEKARTDDESLFATRSKAYVFVITSHETTIADSPQFKGVAERCLGIVENTSLAARTQVALLSPA